MEDNNKYVEIKEAWQGLGKDQKEEEKPKKSLYEEKDDPNKTVEIVIEGLFEKEEEKKLRPEEKKPDPLGSELKFDLYHSAFKI